MLQLLKGPNARCALEVDRTEQQVMLAMLSEDCHIELKSHPLSWIEKFGEGDSARRIPFSFDNVWKPVYRNGPKGPERYPVYEAARKMIRGIFGPSMGFRGGVLHSLMSVLPDGDVHLYTRSDGLVGRFCSVDDAQMIAHAVGEEHPIIFETPEEFMALGAEDREVVLRDIDPDHQWPAKINGKLAEEIFMAVKKSTKKKVTKTATTKPEARSRDDGPVAKARRIFAEMKGKPTADIVAACEKAGVNKGTATTQLGRWRKENGIVVKRGGSQKKPAETKPEDKKSTAKTSTKKATKSKSASKKTPATSKPSAPPPIDPKAKAKAKKDAKAAKKAKALLGEQPSSQGESSSARSEEASGGSPASTGEDVGDAGNAGQSNTNTESAGE